MAGIVVNNVHTAVTAATAAGLVTVTSSAGFAVGARVWLNGAAGNIFCMITSIPDATHVNLRRLPDPGNFLADSSGGGGGGGQGATSTDAGRTGNAIKYPSYSNSDVSAFNAGGFLDQESQLIYVTNADNTLRTQA